MEKRDSKRISKNREKMFDNTSIILGGVGVAADRRMGKFTCRRTQIS